MKLRPVSLAILTMLAALASTSAAAADEERHSYIVQLVDKPAASYTGQVSGLPATKPAAGQRLNVDAADVQAYISYLDAKQADVMATVNAAQITQKYNVVFNGFAAMLTDDEVRALKKNTGVANISADSIFVPDTSYTPRFLGLDKAGGLWQQLGGQAASGEGMVIGVIDTGVWPENPSYADRVDADGSPSHSGTRLVYDAPPVTWKGACDSGEGFAISNCNNKLIGARFFKPASQTLHWTEFNSARDSLGGATGQGGHGTHTSTTAGGNAGVKVTTTTGVPLGVVSGMAPRARIAAYKICWTDGVSGKNGCSQASTVAAIEQAVKDGVNVINYSIGPSAGGGSFSEAGAAAFLGAANAGVFVAASAGNSGPSSTTPAPVSHISPWMTTVGNSTHDRMFVGDVTTGAGTVLTGASNNAFTPSTPLIRSRDAGLASVTNQTSLALCLGGADGVAAMLDPAKVAGKILVCDRGTNALVNKSANAKTAGAVGVVIANVAVTNNTTIVQPHVISTVHVTVADGNALKTYMAAAPTSAVASLGNLRGIINPAVSAPVMNGSSSRGPNVANANIMKPDLTAPGTDILAGVSANLTPDQRDAVAAGGVAPTVEWNFFTGTSMASPHVAGVAALLKQLHPTWTPAMIKSALMTTATDTFSDGLNGSVAWDATARTSGKLPWGQGAGHIAPSTAADPGLVYNLTDSDYTKFLCGVNSSAVTAATCQQSGSIAAYNLNLPSLTAASVLGSLTLTRTVTNVGATTSTYNATTATTGFTAEVTPSVLTLGPGQSASFTVRLTRTTAPLDTWAYGSLTWRDGTHTVRSPVTMRGSAMSVIGSVYSEAAAGTKVITIGTGFTGPMTTIKSGLLPATVESRSVAQADNSVDPTPACIAGGTTGVNLHTVVVPAGQLAVRFALFDADTAGGSKSDLDLLVIRPNNSVLSSGNGGSNEMVHLNNPAAGTYKVCVIGYNPQAGLADYKLSSWVLAPGAINGNFKVLTPGMSYVGGTGSVSMSWSGLDLGKRHLGAVRYLVGGVQQGSTLVEVNTDDPLPLMQSARITPVLVD
jgi:subtilisin family serine protease